MAASAWGALWSVETVDPNIPLPTHYDGMCPSIDVDSHGQPHIAYGVMAKWVSDEYFQFDFDLRYAQRKGGVWSTQDVMTKTPDRDSIGRFPSMQLDSHDNVHISCQETQFGGGWEGDLWYVYGDGSGWHPEEAEDWRTCGHYSHLSLYESGGTVTPFISHNEHANRDF